MLSDKCSYLQGASFKKGFPLQEVLGKEFLMNAVYFQGALFKNVRVNDVPFQGVKGVICGVGLVGREGCRGP